MPTELAPTPTAIIDTDQVASQHLGAIADSTTQATGNQTEVQDIQPQTDQHPLQGVTQSIVNISDPALEKIPDNESELVDIMKGLQGKPRTGNALDFLKEKMQLLESKSGGKVSLIKKEK